MKKKIIVPVDFSSASQNAYWFARKMAEVYGASLELIHVFSGTFSTNDLPAFQLGKSQETIIQENLEDFASIHPKGQGNVLTKVKVETQALPGFAISAIVKKSKDPSTLLIIMGNRGTHNVVEKVFGSVSSNIAQNAHCPVLLIPPAAQYQDFSHILFSCDFKTIEKSKVKKILDFAKIFRASLHFVHVYKPGEPENFLPTEEFLLQQLFKEGDPNNAIIFNTIEAPSVLEGLNQYALENTIDLLVLLNRKRSFFDSVVGKSVTKQMAGTLSFPVMVYHGK